MQKKILYWIGVVVIFLSVGMFTYASEIIDPVNKDQVMTSQLDLLNWNDVKAIEEQLKGEAQQLKSFDLQDKVMALVTGQERFSVQEVMGYIAEAFFGEIYTYMNIVVRFMLIVMLCSLLQTLTTSFKSNNITKISFIVCYMLVIYTIMSSLFMIVNLASETIRQLCDMMMVAVPTLLGFMAVSGYITSSTALAPVIVGGMNIIAIVIQKFILPAIVGIVILQIVSTMSEEIKIDKLVKLFYRGAKYVLKTILVVSVGIMGIYKVTLPLMDVAMKKGALTFGTAFLPVVGDVTQGALQFIMASAQMVKNSFAVGVIIWICILVGIPLIKILAYTVLYHLAGAVMQPIGDKKMVNIAGNLAKGLEFVISCVGIVSILCLAVMLICISIGTNLT